MNDPQNITSRPFHPDQCCERCVFGRGEHAGWCEIGARNRRLQDIGQKILDNVEVEWTKALEDYYGIMRVALDPATPGERITATEAQRRRAQQLSASSPKLPLPPR